MQVIIKPRHTARCLVTHSIKSRILFAFKKSRDAILKYPLAILAVKEQQADISPNMAYLTGELFDDYIHDMKIVQE